MVMKTVTKQDIYSDLDGVVALLKEGTEIILVENDKPVIRLALVDEKPRGRTPGLLPGSMQTTDDFDEPLPDEFWLGQDE
jgi:antitoxin (DNA-binding transcriptional repressor) of toxin-antitoxin stability system